MNYKIYTCYHNDKLIKEYGLTNDNHHILYPTHKPTHKIDINYLHDHLSEICAMYYVWKNNEYCDFIGFEHYRRRFNINNIPELKSDECYVRFYDEDMGRTVKEQYRETLCLYDWDIYINILNKLYGKDNIYVNYLNNSNAIIWDDIFIMSYENFDKLCTFIFSVFDEFNKITKVNYNLYLYKKFYNNSNYLLRPHMYERLISAYILSNFQKDKFFTEVYYKTKK